MAFASRDWSKHENPRSGLSVSGLRLKPGNSKIEAGLLLTELQHLVWLYHINNCKFTDYITKYEVL